MSILYTLFNKKVFNYYIVLLSFKFDCFLFYIPYFIFDEKFYYVSYIAMKKFYFVITCFSAVLFAWCVHDINGIGNIDNIYEIDDTSWVNTWDSIDVTFCKENGGTIERLEFPDWKYMNSCVFDDWSYCDTINYYNWICKPGTTLKSSSQTKQDSTDGQNWSLLAFNWKEVDWKYVMTITDDGKLNTKFCNSINWNVNFEWNENEWLISASLISTKMACEWESMNLENSFKIDWAEYNKIVNEDWWFTMIIKTDNWDKYMWRLSIN